MSEKQYLHQTVAIVVPYKFIPPMNGGQKVCYEFCIALSKHLKILCLSTKQEGIDRRIEIVEVFKHSARKYFNLSLISNLIRIFRDKDVGLCIVHHPYLAGIVYFACKLARVSLIVYSHNLEYRRFKHSKVFLLPFVFVTEYFAYRLGHAAFFISQRERDDAIRLFRLDKEKCFVVPIIAERSTSKSISTTPEEDCFSIIFYGNFLYPPNLKGLNALLFEICPLIAGCLQFPYSIQIFGNGLPKFTEITRKKGDGLEAVEFMGYVDELSHHIQAADVLVVPISTGAGSSMKIVEALCLGTTVISTRTGAQGLNIKKCGEKLLLVEDGRWDQFVTKILMARNSNLTLLPTPPSFFNAYAEHRIMNTVLSAIETVQR